MILQNNSSHNITDPVTSLVTLLQTRAWQQPDKQAYTFLHDNGTEERHLSYRQLDEQARAIGARLQELGLAGECILLLYPPGLDYIAAFFGCLYAGAVAVPAYPPDPARLQRTLPRFQALTADSQAKAALTTSAIFAMVSFVFDMAPSLKELHWVVSDEIDSHLADQWQAPAVGPDSLAFLQYTSGSTAVPKGVMLSHGNLLHNSALIQRCFEHTEESRGVIWLPPYHDMGLIGGIIQPLYVGFPVVLMSPLDFLRNPFSWLQAITRYQGTTSGGPNFAYDLCLKKITAEQQASLDLSSWQVAFNGAEPINPKTIVDFTHKFSSCGFKPEAFYPCYGLAEATLIASGGLKREKPILQAFEEKALARNQVQEAAAEGTSRTLVSSGRSLLDQTIVIADPQTGQPCPADQIGEIWVSGPSVSQGYWHQPQLTHDTFQASLPGTDKQTFLRTGDLGFLREGELFVTGRLKDLIIIRGRNYYPQDIERGVEQSHPLLRPGCSAAFSVEVAGVEQLIVVAEIRRHFQESDLDPVVETIRRTVTELFQLQVHHVLLIQAGTIPKTSSGKVQRFVCRQEYLADDLAVVKHHAMPAKKAPPKANSFIRRTLDTVTDASTRQAITVLYLQEQVAQVLGVDPTTIGEQQVFSTMGLDSLISIELLHQLERDLGIYLPSHSFLQDISCQQLAAQILEAEPALDESAVVSEIDNDQGLTYGQRAIWLVQQLAPDNAAYNMPCAFKIEATLEVDALHRAFQQLVNRHAALRTIFPAVRGEPVQQVQAQVEGFFRVEEAAHWQADIFQERLHQEVHRPFDLEKGPLLRVILFKRPSNYILLFVMHHIVGDLWSLSLLAHELGILYQAEQRQAPLPAAALPPATPYFAHVQWQKEMLTGKTGEHLLSYWQQQLAGPLPVLDLPSDRPRPPVQTYNGAAFVFDLDEALRQELYELAKAEHVTPYMLLLAVFQILLHKYTGLSDILVGTPTTGRGRVNWAQTVGYFVNPVVLRGRLEGQQRFLDFLQQIRQTTLDAFTHQDYPFPLLAEKLQPEWDASRTSIFQVMFIWQKTRQVNDRALSALALGLADAQLTIGDVLFESIDFNFQVAQFDLTWMIAEIDGQLQGTVQYNSDLFSPATIQQMVSHFLVLAKSVIAQPQQRIAALNLLTEAERQARQRWNKTEMPYAREQCLHHLVDEQAKNTPDKIALVFGEQHITYQTLNSQANDLAQRLRQQYEALAPECIVGICMERCPEMVVGLLGILKAGCAYLPMDPAYPPERLAFMLADSQASVLLTQSHLVSKLPAHHTPTICLDGLQGAVGESADFSCDYDASAQNLAYVIYTSGSTGKPKGVAITHQNAVALLAWASEQFDAASLAGVLAATSICFDLSIFELFLPLSQGGTIILVENALQIPNLPVPEAVTLINTVPSILRVLLALNNLPASVQVVNLAGEPLPGDLVQSVHEQRAGAEVFNLYGPTEDTTYSTFAHLKRGNYDLPPIGGPIANTQVYLLDQSFNPVPVGVPGEVYLAGDGLARGYLNRSGMTAEKFLPHPFTHQQGQRLYRTGDLARYQADGNIEFLGRLDHQIKLRGFRIELEEIEMVLRQHPAIQEAVVVVQNITSLSGEKQLVAYIQGDEAVTADLDEVRRFLKKKLPAYMLPAVFVILDAFPLTANGKINRLALPVPVGDALPQHRTVVTPRSPIEAALADIWAAVLGVEQISMDDDFFAIGGHSILAIRIISRLRENLGVDLPVQRLLELPTIAELAQYIETVALWSEQNAQPPVETTDREEGVL